MRREKKEYERNRKICCFLIYPQLHHRFQSLFNENNYDGFTCPLSADDQVLLSFIFLLLSFSADDQVLLSFIFLLLSFSFPFLFLLSFSFLLIFSHSLVNSSRGSLLLFSRGKVKGLREGREIA